MDPAKFNKMHLDERGEYLWKNGKYLTDRVKYNEFKAALYQLENFYVEVFYCVPENKIKGIRALEDESKLDAYCKLPVFWTGYKCNFLVHFGKFYRGFII